MSVIKPQPMCYAIAPVTALAAGGIATPTFTINNKADFYLCEIRAIYTKVAAFTTGGITMQASVAGSDMFSNGAVNILSFAAGNQTPNVGIPLKFPELKIPKNTQIQVQITNADAAVVALIQVQFWGYEVES